MKRSDFASVAFALWATLLGSLSEGALPDIVVFLSDDHSQLDSEVYGATDVRTPNMKRFAASGITFTHAFIASPACAPSRTAMLTGLMPARNGAEANHTFKRNNVASLPEVLRKQGYQTVAFGKVAHGKFDGKRHGFDQIDERHDAEFVESFLKQRDKTKPLCLFVGTHEPHVPWLENKGYEARELKLPPTHLDTPETREFRAKYYTDVTDADRRLGEVMDLTRRYLEPSNTLMIYSSDHGAQWPFGKWNLYDAGIRVPLIASWPGVIAPQSRTDAMVQWIDLLPTLIEVAGGSVPQEIDGRSFLPVLRDPQQRHREMIFTTHSGDGRMNVYPIRSVRSQDWKLIRNLHPEFAHTTHIDKALAKDGGRYWISWYDQAQKDKRAHEVVQRYHQRPAVELYDLQSDPYEQHNLAESPQHAERLATMQRALDTWMAEQADQQQVFQEPRLLSDPESIKPGENAAKENAAQAKQPNVLIILADDLGYSDLGCYGGEIQTPNIDALAANGARFTQVYNSARCCPSRASLMTGLYPTQAGIGDFTSTKPNEKRGPGYLGRLSEHCVTLAEVLKPSGYGCFYVGKWHMHPQTGPIARGFDEFYGYTNDHSHDQYDRNYYVRLPKGRAKEIDPPDDRFYATDVFNDYALEFIKQGQQQKKPWFVFLGHSSPHFPVQAPAERADKYNATYLRGWDVLRNKRFERMKQIGLVNGEHWKLTPRSSVPVDRDDIANGFSGKENPAWDSLPLDRQRDLARRMAVFAAMVEGVDKGVGQIVDHLKQTKDLDNTLILFLSDNGACYEWGPFGFDGESRRGETTLHQGEELARIGGQGTHHSYGSGWANLGNTPLRSYKHFTYEGGISTPFIVHWPQRVGKVSEWIRQPAHLMDVMPTIMDATGAVYPAEYKGKSITPREGVSLLAMMKGVQVTERSIGFDHQEAHALRQGDWKIVWSKREPNEIKWELYNLATDRCELVNLADQYPERVAEMVKGWDAWARRVGVKWEPEKD